MYNALMEAVFWFLSRKLPAFVKWLLRRVGGHNLPRGYDIDTHFKPRYNPWDQRMCLIPDADFYTAISEGRAAVVTDHIGHFDATGIALESGAHLDADIIVTATACSCSARRRRDQPGRRGDQSAGPLRVQGAHARSRAKPVLVRGLHERLLDPARRHHRPRDGKLLAHMAARGYTHAFPHLGNESMDEKPSWDIQANYVKRSLHALPKSGTKRPWNVRQKLLRRRH